MSEIMRPLRLYASLVFVSVNTLWGVAMRGLNHQLESNLYANLCRARILTPIAAVFLYGTPRVSCRSNMLVSANARRKWYIDILIFTRCEIKNANTSRTLFRTTRSVFL